MNLSCPHCSFTKEIDPARVPEGVKKVVCPRCKEPFTLPECLQRDSAKPATAVQPSPSLQAHPENTVVPPAVVSTATTAAIDLPKAGFWIRVVASLVDSFLAGFTQFCFALILAMTAGSLMDGMDPDSSGAYTMLTTLFGIVFGIVYSVFFTGYCGQTPGKMVLRIKVIRTNGAEISYGRAFLREVPGKFLSVLILGIGYLMVAFDDRKQGLHDRIADTYVVKL
jgi:uncharacterized RDD family membrane protein YckC